MLNIEVLLPEFSKAVSKCYEMDRTKLLISELAFHESEAELFGSAIKYCCNYRKVPMDVVGRDINLTSETTIDPSEYTYDNVESLGKKVKELARNHQVVHLIPSDISDLCSNCGINI